MSEDIIAEVSADLRREQMQNLWRSFGKYAITASIAVILGTAVFVGVQEYRARQRATWTDALAQAQQWQQVGKYDEAAASLATVIENGNEQFVALAQVKQAALTLKQKQSGAIITPQPPRTAQMDLYVRFTDVLKAYNGEGVVLDAGHPFALLLEEASAMKRIATGDEIAGQEALRALADRQGIPNSLRDRARLLGGGDDAPQK